MRHDSDTYVYILYIYVRSNTVLVSSRPKRQKKEKKEKKETDKNKFIGTYSLLSAKPQTDPFDPTQRIPVVSESK